MDEWWERVRKPRTLSYRAAKTPYTNFFHLHQRSDLADKYENAAPAHISCHYNCPVFSGLPLDEPPSANSMWRKLICDEENYSNIVQVYIFCTNSSLRRTSDLRSCWNIFFFNFTIGYFKHMGRLRGCKNYILLWIKLAYTVLNTIFKRGF